MAILKHTYKVAITRTNIGYDIAAQRLISRIKRQNQRDEHPREYTIE